MTVTLWFNDENSMGRDEIQITFIIIWIRWEGRERPCRQSVDISK